MNRIYVTLILLLASFGKAHSQDTIAKQQAYTAYKYWAAKLPLCNIIDLSCPNLLLGAERRIDKHNGVQLLAGLSIDPTSGNKNGHSVVNGFRVKAEYRRYFRVRRNSAFYLAGEGFYTAYSHYTSDSFTSQASGTNYSDNFYIQKKMWGGDLKWGYQKQVSRHFMFEVFAGLGFKVKNVTQTNRTVPGDEQVVHRAVDINLYAMANQLGTYTTITMPINFVLGYNFR